MVFFGGIIYNKNYHFLQKKLFHKFWIVSVIRISVCNLKFLLVFKSHSHKSATFRFDRSAKNVKNGPKNAKKTFLVC